MNQAEAQNDAKMPANDKLVIKATMCSTESTDSTNTTPRTIVETNKIKVHRDKSRNITEMRRPKIWGHHYIPSLSK